MDDEQLSNGLVLSLWYQIGISVILTNSHYDTVICLSNFAQLEPLDYCVWTMTCLFLSVSRNSRLNSLFWEMVSSVRLDEEIFLISATDFYFNQVSLLSNIWWKSSNILIPLRTFKTTARCSLQLSAKEKVTTSCHLIDIGYLLTEDECLILSRTDLPTRRWCMLQYYWFGHCSSKSC